MATSAATTNDEHPSYADSRNEDHNGTASTNEEHSSYADSINDGQDSIVVTPMTERPNAYTVYINEGADFVNEHKGSTSDLYLALKWLKLSRERVCYGFVGPRDLADMRAFPYGNHIGLLRNDDSNHWGYGFRMPRYKNVITAWVEKTSKR